MYACFVHTDLCHFLCTVLYVVNFYDSVSVSACHDYEIMLFLVFETDVLRYQLSMLKMMFV